MAGGVCFFFMVHFISQTYYFGLTILDWQSVIFDIPIQRPIHPQLGVASLLIDDSTCRTSTQKNDAPAWGEKVGYSASINFIVRRSEGHPLFVAREGP